MFYKSRNRIYLKTAPLQALSATGAYQKFAHGRASLFADIFQLFLRCEGSPANLALGHFEYFVPDGPGFPGICHFDVSSRANKAARAATDAGGRVEFDLWLFDIAVRPGLRS